MVYLSYTLLEYVTRIICGNAHVHIPDSNKSPRREKVGDHLLFIPDIDPFRYDLL